MANINAPFGLRPSRHLTGGTTQTTEYPIADAYDTKIYLGDPVGLTAGEIVIGTDAGTEHVGVFAGCKFVDSTGDTVFSKSWQAAAGTTEIKALIWDDPAQIFAIEADTADTTNIGVAYDLDVTAGVDTVGVSATFLNTAATVGAAYKVIGLVNTDDNEPGEFAKVEVVAVKHALASS